MERWELQVAPEIAKWLGQNRTNPTEYVRSVAASRGLDLQILKPETPDANGSRDVAAILLGSAAVIKALTPLLLELIKRTFPDATAVHNKSQGLNKLKIDTK